MESELLDDSTKHNLSMNIVHFSRLPCVTLRAFLTDGLTPGQVVDFVAGGWDLSLDGDSFTIIKIKIYLT